MRTRKMIEICQAFDITLDQFLFLYILLYEHTDVMKEFLAFKEITQEELEDLDEKGVIVLRRVNGKKGFSTADIMVQPPFRERMSEIEVDSYDAATELREAYFDMVIVDGTRYPARNIGEENLRKEYLKIHKGDPEIHAKILKKTKILVSRTARMVDGLKVGKQALKAYIESQGWILIPDDAEEQAGGMQEHI